MNLLNLALRDVEEALSGAVWQIDAIGEVEFSYDDVLRIQDPQREEVRTLFRDPGAFPLDFVG